jgi:hypothetical protein
LQLITPFTSTISDGSKDVLIQINAILWAELWLTPGLRLLDLVGNLKKHLLAPRAMNQETMNLNFQGALNEQSLEGSDCASDAAASRMMRINRSRILFSQLGTPVNMGERYDLSLTSMVKWIQVRCPSHTRFVLLDQVY